MAQHISPEKGKDKVSSLHTTRPAISGRTSGPLSALQKLANESAPVQKLMALQKVANRRFAPVQREIEDDDDVQQNKATKEAEPTQRRESAQSSNGLPSDLKSGIENLSGISMDDVTVQRNSSEPAKVGAHAFAQGTNIHLGPGQDKHLPHEAWHVVQQKQGRVRPTIQMKGVAINDDVGLEREADVMGVRAISATDPETMTPTINYGITKNAIVQRYNVNNIENVDELTLTPNQRKLYSHLRTALTERIVSRELSEKAHTMLAEHPDEARDIRTAARSMRVALDKLDALIGAIPDDIFALTDIKSPNGEEIEKQVKVYHKRVDAMLLEVDFIYQSLHKKTVSRTFNHFYGDTRYYTYYSGESSNTAIPIVWYKAASDYDPIKLSAPDDTGETLFEYPNGPIIGFEAPGQQGRQVDLCMRGADGDPFANGKVFRNRKNESSRDRQSLIRQVLINYGYDHANKDGDHIVDLGFEGRDRDDNIWPLNSKINQRPFHGWRSLYGLNYKISTEQYATGTPNSLQNKYFKVKDRLSSNSEAVPFEGKMPQIYSGGTPK